VFPVRYGLNSYILFRRNSVFEVLMAKCIRTDSACACACLGQG
jgi:hypothetical protein